MNSFCTVFIVIGLTLCEPRPSLGTQPPAQTLEMEEEGNPNGSSVAEKEPGDDLRKTYYFGCGPCHPKWMQYLFARKVFFTAILSTFTFLQTGLVSGIDISA